MSDVTTPAVKAGPDVRAVLVDAGIVLGTFALLGVIGAFIWHQVTPLATYTATKDNALMDQLQLAKQVSTDGWFFMIALGGGLLAGAGLMWWRGRDPVVTVVLIALGSALAAFLMVRVGLDLGPGDLKAAFAKAAVGEKVPIRLAPHGGDVRLNLLGVHLSAPIVSFMWPIGAVLGTLGVLFLTPPRATQQTPDRQPAATFG
ncbi:MAG: hypothetical protein JWR35_2331 [Marmoricola sp.]|jgi:hypothetical protein|nr:hypothetical protein [Marmoricola sp.]